MSNQNIRPRGYAKPSVDVQLGVKSYIAEHGEQAAFDYFGVSRGTIARCAGGLVLQGATLRAIQDGLRQVEEEAR